MNINLITDTLAKKNRGTWFNVGWTSDMPLTAEAKRQGYTAYKKTKATMRYGISYKNIATVKERFKDEINVKHELSWGQWVPGHEGVLIEHKGQKYVRLYTSPNKFKSIYFVNGHQVTKEALMVMGIIQPSYFKKPEIVPECLTLKVENIDYID